MTTTSPDEDEEAFAAFKLRVESTLEVLEDELEELQKFVKKTQCSPDSDDSFCVQAGGKRKKRRRKSRKKKHKTKRKKRKSRTRKGGDNEKMLMVMKRLNTLIQKLKKKKKKGELSKKASEGLYAFSTGVAKIKKHISEGLIKGKNGLTEIKKVLVSSVGNHTACLLTALANQEKCVQNYMLKDGANNKSVGLNTICSVDSIQKVIDNWDNMYSEKRDGCGVQIAEDLVNVSTAKVSAGNAQYQRVLDENPEKRREHDKIMKAFDDALKREREDDAEQKRLYGEDAILLQPKKNVFGKENSNLVTFGGSRRKRKTHRRKSGRRKKATRKSKRRNKKRQVK